MKKEVYVCWHESDTDEIDRYDLLLVSKGPYWIMDPDNLIASYPVSHSPSGTPLISTNMLDKMAELQNQGYHIEFFF